MKALLLILVSSCALAQTVSIGPPVFTGSGLNDATSGGTFTSPAANHYYTATIAASGTPDTVTFSRDGGTATAAVNVTGAAQAMTYPAGTVTAASCTASRITFTAASHGLLTGAQATVTGAAPSGYNVANASVLRVSATQFSVPVGSCPAAWTSGGTVTGSDGVTITWAATTGHSATDYWTVTATANGSVNSQTFVQQGTGAVVARSAQAKMRDIVSVKDFSGTDTQALQTAINSLQISGGTILMPAGNYSICAVTIRTPNANAPITISGYGAVINPICANQWVFTILGSSNKVLGATFQGVGGTQYQGIEITSDATTTHTQFCIIKDVYMNNMWQGIWMYMDAVGTPTAVTYRNQIVDSTIENFYNQKTWTGSFGVSFDGPGSGNAGGNDARMRGTGVKGYVSNVIVRNSAGTKISGGFIDGGADGILYDGGSNLQLDDVYMEYNTNVVTTASTNGQLPYEMTVVGGTQASYTNCLNGSLYASSPPTQIGNNGASCFLPDIGIIGERSGGVTQTPAVNEFDIGPFSLGSAATDKIAVKLNGGGDWVMDFTALNVAKTFTFYRPSQSMFFTSLNMAWDSLDFSFGTAASSHIQFPFTSGLGSALHSNGGSASNYNGLWLAANETKASTTGGVPANSALPSWAVDIGGYDDATFSDADSFSIYRKPAGTSQTYVKLMHISTSTGATHLYGNVNMDGQLALTHYAFSSLGVPGDGALAYCTDCKNSQDGFTGGACVTGGTGTVAQYDHGNWNCMGGGSSGVSSLGGDTGAITVGTGLQESGNVLSIPAMVAGYTGTTNVTNCSTIMAGIPSGCSNSTYTWVNGVLQ
jgi:hypothetical protein